MGGKYILQYIKIGAFDFSGIMVCIYFSNGFIIAFFKVISFTSFLNLDLWAWFLDR